VLVSAAEAPAARAPGGEPTIVADDVSVVLGGQPILSHVSLTVGAGEVLALLGANGSGKSTLVRALLGVVPATSGSVRLFGAPLGSAVPWDRVGYVPQRLPAASGVPATALEVVASGLLHGRRLRPPRGARARALAALESVGLAGQAYRRVQEMSGGQQQRVLIARALVSEPHLLVLDEPTTGIDVPTQATFVDTVARLHDAGTSVVVILHEIGAFAPLIDRAVVLRHGRVVHDGPPPAARADHAGADHVHEHAHPDPEPPPTGPTLEVMP
jgi:zinc transport system ATP-binding protein